MKIKRLILLFYLTESFFLNSKEGDEGSELKLLSSSNIEDENCP